MGAARKAEMEAFKKHGVCEKVPIEECFEEIGKGPVGFKWGDAKRATRRNRSTAAG